MSWTSRAPLLIVALAVVPAGVAVELSASAGSWPGFVAVGGAAIGLGWSAALWFRHRDQRPQLALGLCAALLVFIMAGLGMWRGRAERHAPAGPTPELEMTGGWMGETTIAGVKYIAVEHGTESAIAQKINAMFARPFALVLITVDNRSGSAPVELGVADAQLEPPSAGKDAVLARGPVLASDPPPVIVPVPMLAPKPGFAPAEPAVA